MGNASPQSGPRFLNSRLGAPTTAAQPSRRSQSVVNTPNATSSTKLKPTMLWSETRLCWLLFCCVSCLSAFRCAESAKQHADVPNQPRDRLPAVRTEKLTRRLTFKNHVSWYLFCFQCINYKAKSMWTVNSSFIFFSLCFFPSWFRLVNNPVWRPSIPTSNTKHLYSATDVVKFMLSG